MPNIRQEKVSSPPMTKQKVNFYFDKTHYDATLILEGYQAPIKEECYLCGGKILLPENKITPSAIVIEKATIVNLKNSSETLPINLHGSETKNVQEYINMRLLNGKHMNVHTKCLKDLSFFLDE